MVKSQNCAPDQGLEQALGNWREFGCHDDANAWRKSIKKQTNTNFFYCNLESKNLSIH